MGKKGNSLLNPTSRHCPCFFISPPPDKREGMRVDIYKRERAEVSEMREAGDKI